ncbi:nuclear pore complex protein Nup153-like isoform X3 [Eleutherodactylus coqui]|uniref:nuclear pore complex protein Nup153-like isoform X3 n=1 Tax=Eleutherodactylus coqui TaxID=57060 RepID=UPI003462418D
MAARGGGDSVSEGRLWTRRFYMGSAIAPYSRSRQQQAPVRQSIPRPATAKSYGVVSTAARRILQSWEMSSPLAEPPKYHAPDAPTRQLADSLSYPKFSTPASIGKIMRERGSHSTTKLPDEAQVTNSTSSNREFTFSAPIVKSTESNAQPPGSSLQEPPKYHAPDAPTRQLANSLSYPKFSTPASNGKIMRERGSHSTTKLPDEDVEAPDLPEISLPISTTALPAISSSLQTKTTPPPPSVFSTAQVTSSTSNNPEFTFSAPIVKPTDSIAQPPGSFDHRLLQSLLHFQLWLRILLDCWISSRKRLERGTAMSAW